ncbi:terpene cyclase/mutase family protein [Alienimonas californiensis]|uniref:Squalene--hopene cyclase n=1 Tax=Alienimonas californiensis TaxID=2527989 RepID=A0A517P9L8_9PLAN|nr:prenyltransferase/squalene oxidase repeat-containing protein [Alienimonas californiensis]QDT16064.1 Squalene--hopene cyclase [Alienimonas californiensis]
MLSHRFADVAAGSVRNADLPRPADRGAEVGPTVAKARDALLALQQEDGHWCGELEGDSILQSEYLCLLAWLGRERTDDARAVARHLISQQEPGGWWGQYPGGPIDVSATVKAVLALRAVYRQDAGPGAGAEAGDRGPADLDERLAKAKRATLAAGGAERVNSFTRYYLALLGQIAYRQCPAVPPEVMLAPRWSPLNLTEMSAWSRTIVVPLSLLWAYQPCRDLPAAGVSVGDLFVNGAENLPLRMPRCEAVDREVGASKFDWHTFFYRLDRTYKAADAARLRPLRRIAVKKAERWILDRLVGSDGLGAIFPPIVWTIVGLKCLGYAEDSPEIAGQLDELDRLKLTEANDAGEAVTRLQPCKSPVWDTAIAAIALRESGLPPHHPTIRRAADWLLEREIRTPGDYSLARPKLKPSGWCFEYRNRFYPDTDDTCMVLMALARCLPAGSGTDWTADIGFSEDPEAADDDRTVLAARDVDPRTALGDVAAAAPLTAAIRRGVNWLIGMQNRDGGWGAFDVDNTRELYCRVPFADHNAMIDPSTADLTARMLELFGLLGMPADQPFMKRAIAYVNDAQEADGSWYGRWGVNYFYGTWQGLMGLAALGVRSEDARVRRAVRWLKSVQQPSGGFGESPATYDDPNLRGQGEPTASQTAWALMGLVAAGDARTPAARRAAAWLRDKQNLDGTWTEPQFTGTGFPSVFYLKYHLYSLYFPLMALARYERAVR